MASENFLARDDKGSTQRVKLLTTADGVETYTAKTGRPADDFMIDRFIAVETTDGYDMVITLPDGVYKGQELIVLFEIEANAETVDVSTTTGDNGTQLTAAGGYNIFRWAGPTIGWILTASSAT